MFFIARRHTLIVRKIVQNNNRFGRDMLLSQETMIAINRAAFASTALDDYCTSPFKIFLSFFTPPGFGLRYKAFIELDKLTVSFNKDVRNHKQKMKSLEKKRAKKEDELQAGEQTVEGKMPYLINKKFQALNKRADAIGYDLQRNEDSSYRMLLINSWFYNYKPSKWESLVSLLPGTNAYTVRKEATKTIDEMSKNLEAGHAKKQKAMPAKDELCWKWGGEYSPTFFTKLLKFAPLEENKQSEKYAKQKCIKI